MRRSVFWLSSAVVAVISASVVTAGTMSALAQPSHITLTWFTRANPQENAWERKVIALFEKQHPNATVNLELAPLANVDQKLQTMVAGGDPPDVFIPDWGYNGFAGWKGDLLSLNPYMKRDPGVLNGFNTKIVNFYNIDGQTLVLPVSSLGSFLFYNKDLFNKAHLAYPPTNWDDKSWTWEKMLQDAKALTKITSNPGTSVFGVNDGLWPENADSWLWGGDYFSPKAYQTGKMGTPTITSSRGVQVGIQQHWDLIYKYKLSPTATETTGLAALGDPFLSGRIGMEMTGGWAFSTFSPANFKWGVAALPYTSSGRRDVLFTDGIGIEKDSKYPTLDWDLIKDALNPQTGLTWLVQDVGYTPAQSQALSKWYPDRAAETGMTVKQIGQLQNGAYKYGSESANHLIAGYNTIGSTLDQSLNAVYSGQMTIPDALQQMQKHLLSLHLN